MSLKNKKITEENKSLHSLLDKYDFENKKIQNKNYP